MLSPRLTITLDALLKAELEDFADRKNLSASKAACKAIAKMIVEQKMKDAVAWAPITTTDPEDEP